MASPGESPSFTASFSVTIAPSVGSGTVSPLARSRKCHRSWKVAASSGATMVVMASAPSAPWAIMEASVARTATGSCAVSDRMASAASRAPLSASAFSLITML